MINGTRIPPCVENDFMSREGAVDACAQKGPYHTKLKREMSREGLPRYLIAGRSLDHLPIWLADILYQTGD
jgi:hypothetical protein